MEEYLVQALVQAGGTTPPPVADGSCCSLLWQWGFWLAFAVGVVETVVSIFKKAPDSL